MHLYSPHVVRTFSVSHNGVLKSCNSGVLHRLVYVCVCEYALYSFNSENITSINVFALCSDKIFKTRDAHNLFKKRLKVYTTMMYIVHV